MNTQEIINELTRNDRFIIRDTLRMRYSIRYIDYMFNNRRKRTALFKRTVKTYWNSKQELATKIEKLMNEFQKEKDIDDEFRSKNELSPEFKCEPRELISIRHHVKT